MCNGLMSAWMKTLFFGDYDTFQGEAMKMLWSDLQTEEDAKKLIEKRETRMNITSIFLVIIGARCLESSLPELRAMQDASQNGHIGILKELLNMGANLQAKDIAGQTPLHHCLTAFGNNTTLQMAELLLIAGADPNLQNRFGSTPLPECIMASKIDAIKLLLKFGTKPEIQDYDGTSALDMALHYPLVRELFSKNGSSLAKQERKELRAEGAFKCGGGCGKTGSKRCTGCYLVYFCSNTCLKSAWKTHKTQCKETKSHYKTVQLKAHSGCSFSNLTGETFIHKPTDRPAKKHFVVKVQGKEGKDLMMYNEERSMMGHLCRRGNEVVYDALCRVLEDHGVQGQKAFFYAIFKERNRSAITLDINPETMVPAETW